MAGMKDPTLDILVQLNQEGWTVVDMNDYGPKIGEIANWCRENFGNMLINPDVDISRWFGATVTTTDKQRVFFAFKDAADYTMLQLRWA